MKSNYANLDLLRSFAVLSVVAAHLWHGCVDFHLCAYSETTNQILHNLSFTGVMFFFVHTCLVLMLSLHRAPVIHRTRSFLFRRALRIYPLCWATILLALTTGLTDQPGATIHNLGWIGITTNVLLVKNFLHRVPSVIGPLWSLPWEVQMYLLLPLFYVLLRRYERWIPALPMWLGGTFLACVATLPQVPRALHAAIFPPMFISGMVAYQFLCRQQKTLRSKKLPAAIWPFFVFALFLTEGLLIGKRSFESPIGALLNACICLLLGLAIPSFYDLRLRWLVVPAQQVAKYSYGIYLLHIPALMIVLRFFPELSLPLKVVSFLALTALFSVVSFHAIEDPLIRLGKHLTRSEEANPRAALTEPPEMISSSTASIQNAQPPLVSIITPVYNAAHWLPEMLASVRMQSFTHWEQIFVDDGSTDGSFELLNEAAREDSRFRVLRTARNSGPSLARNLAIEAAQGRFIAFLDADDLWLPEKLSRSIEWMTSHGYAFIYHDYRHISHDGVRVGALITGPEVLDLKTLHTRRGTGGCLSIVLDRQQVSGFHFPTDLRILHEDFCAWLSVIEKGHIGHRLPADLGRYRLSAHSRSSNKLAGAINTWLIYREISGLPLLRAASWWLLYAWNGFWLYRFARPR